MLHTVAAAMLVGAYTVLSLPAQTRPRVIAIGDIHGAGDRVVALLEQVGLVDHTASWSGGSDVLVQTGDFTDRGPQVRPVMDLLMRLEAEAQTAGGRVVVLLGNHETMNLTATTRDATPEIFRSFASDGGTTRRDAAYLQYAEYATHRQAALGRPLPNIQTRDEWMDTHPPGYIEYTEAMGPNGHYGRWLRQKPVAAVFDDTLFLHGGLAADLAVTDVAEVNEQISGEIRRFDEIRAHLIEEDVILPFSTLPEIGTAVTLELNAWVERLSPGPPAPGRSPRRLTRGERNHVDTLLELQGMADWLVIDSDGPLWYRGFAQWTDEEGERVLPSVLKQFGVSRVVAGHNVTPTRRITPRFGGRLFLIDTGMLASSYRGQASALELRDDEITAVYLTERVNLESGAERRAPATR